jgi:hypothetical protein
LIIVCYTGDHYFNILCDLLLILKQV